MGQSLRGVAPQDRLLVTSTAYTTPLEVTVLKVGRRWVSTSDGRKYSIEDGQWEHYGPSFRNQLVARTPTEYRRWKTEEQEIEQLSIAVHERGIRELPRMSRKLLLALYNPGLPLHVWFLCDGNGRPVDPKRGFLRLEEADKACRELIEQRFRTVRVPKDSAPFPATIDGWNEHPGVAPTDRVYVSKLVLAEED